VLEGLEEQAQDCIGGGVGGVAAHCSGIGSYCLLLGLGVESRPLLLLLVHLTAGSRRGGSSKIESIIAAAAGWKTSRAGLASRSYSRPLHYG